VDATVEFLRRLAAGDERCVRAVLSGGHGHPRTLDRVTRALVRLAALIAADASTTSLRWAAEKAATAGADDAVLVQVLVSAATAAGAAQTVTSAPRLALAIDVDMEVDGWDGM